MKEKGQAQGPPEGRVDPMEMALLEQDLIDLKREKGLPLGENWRTRLGAVLTRRSGGPRRVKRSTYIKLAACCGWFCGAHRFYTGQKFLGALYLLFCWTGIPVAMTLIDLMVVLPMEADEEGRVLL